MLSLEDEALDAVLEIDDAEIAKDDGADMVFKVKRISLLQNTRP